MTSTTNADRALPNEGELQTLWSWNATVPPAPNAYVHGLFEEQAQSCPDSSAICGFDENFTYYELSQRSTQLAHLLAEAGVGRGSMVLLCFMKTSWAIVAMLGVVKAGGTFIPLDPRQPITRLERIVQQTNATILLTSGKNEGLVSCPGGRNIVLNHRVLSYYPQHDITLDLNPTSTAYVIFTSGSTGDPKGVMIDHRSFATSMIANGCRAGLSKETRMLQFAVYTFDACIFEIFATLIHGGCICVPDENRRLENLSMVVHEMRVSTALLTPSVAQLLEPSEVPTLSTLILTGEKIVERDLTRWSGTLRLMNSGGPTECSVICNAHDVDLDKWSAPTIGKAVGCVSWVVDSQDHNQLCAIGVVGELVIEGPMLARGYLDDEEKTKKVFIEAPPWLEAGIQGHPGRRSILYKTGDLVKYNADGTLVHMGRTGSQVKLRGQRFDLGEVEHKAQMALHGATVVATIITRGCEDNTETALALCIKVSEKVLTDFEEPDKPGNGDNLPIKLMLPTSELEVKLSENLPSYMIPTVFSVAQNLPITSSGKMDRRRIQHEVSVIWDQYLLGCWSKDCHPQLLTEHESRLRHLWADIFNRPIETITLEDNFFQIGGNSMAAMKLVCRARKEGIILTIPKIFQHKTLYELAKVAKLDA